MSIAKFPPRTTLYFKMGDHKPRTSPSMNSVGVPMISLEEHEHLIREARAKQVEHGNASNQYGEGGRVTRLSTEAIKRLQDDLYPDERVREDFLEKVESLCTEVLALRRELQEIKALSSDSAIAKIKGNEE